MKCLSNSIPETLKSAPNIGALGNYKDHIVWSLGRKFRMFKETAVRIREGRCSKRPGILYKKR